MSNSLLICASHILLPNGEFLKGDVEIQLGEIVKVPSEISPGYHSNIAVRGKALQFHQ